MMKWVLLGIVACALLFHVAPDRLADEELPAETSRRSTPSYRSPLDICLSPDGLHAYVVNQTANSVSVIDIKGRKVINDFPVGSHPASAAVSADGKTLYVTRGWGSTVEVVDLASGQVIQSLPTGLEPYGVTVSVNGDRLYVVNSLSDSVSVLALQDGGNSVTFQVGREPRYLAETPNGMRLIVGNGLSRNVSIIDLETRTVQSRDLGRASILRGITCSSDGRWAFVAHIVSRDEQIALQMERGWIHSNGISVLDLQQPGHYVTVLLDRLLDGAANPWGMALSPDGRRLYVSLSGVHEIAIVDVHLALQLVQETELDDVLPLAEDVEIVDRLKIARRVDAGGIGPRGIAFSAATQELLVANYFSDTISVLDPESGSVKSVIPLGGMGEMSLERKGEMLFNDARLCYQRWFSCASCHQEDASVDGLNWDLPNDGMGNPKNVKSLHDAADTPPAMWAAVRDDMDAAVAAGQRFMGFLPEPENHAALLAYIRSSRRAPNPYQNRDPNSVKRGEALFRRARCHTCHPPPTFTDRKLHDLGFAAESDLRSRFDTPSLRECYRTAPYLHGGQATTLREIFTDYNPNDHHGRTSDLSAEELEDLLQYVRSL